MQPIQNLTIISNPWGDMSHDFKNERHCGEILDDKSVNHVLLIKDYDHLIGKNGLNHDWRHEDHLREHMSIQNTIHNSTVKK